MDVSCFKEGTKPTSRPWSRHITTHVDLPCSSLGVEWLAQVVTPVLGDRHGPRGEGQSACARDSVRFATVEVSSFAGERWPPHACRPWQDRTKRVPPRSPRVPGRGTGTGAFVRWSQRPEWRLGPGPSPESELTWWGSHACGGLSSRSSGSGGGPGCPSWGGGGGRPSPRKQQMLCGGSVTTTSPLSLLAWTRRLL